MSTPNPLQPQGSIHNQSSRGNSTVRIAVFAVVSLHAVFFAGLLMQGCRPDAAKSGTDIAGQSETNVPNTLAELETNYYKTFNELPPVTSDFPPVGASNTLTSTELPPPVEDPIVNEPAVSKPVPGLEPSPAEATPPAAAATEYVVVRGDSFYKIAKAHNVTVNAIAQQNPNVESTRLQVGQKILVPAPKAGTPSSVSSAGSAASGAAVYVVKAGDNLLRIATRQGTTVGALKSANNLRTDRILVGQKLVIPKPVSKTPTPATGGNGQ
jgi:LysM repeat protein